MRLVEVAEGLHRHLVLDPTSPHLALLRAYQLPLLVFFQAEFLIDVLQVLLEFKVSYLLILVQDQFTA